MIATLDKECTFFFSYTCIFYVWRIAKFDERLVRSVEDYVNKLLKEYWNLTVSMYRTSDVLKTKTDFAIIHILISKQDAKPILNI